jgi:hypothetical protein
MFEGTASGKGWGEHQVSGDEDRIEKSFGIAVMAYLFLIRAGHEELVPGQSWRIPQLQHALRLRTQLLPLKVGVCLGTTRSG